MWGYLSNLSYGLLMVTHMSLVGKETSNRLFASTAEHVVDFEPHGPVAFLVVSKE